MSFWQRDDVADDGSMCHGCRPSRCAYSSTATCVARAGGVAVRDRVWVERAAGEGPVEGAGCVTANSETHVVPGWGEPHRLQRSPLPVRCDICRRQSEMGLPATGRREDQL